MGIGGREREGQHSKQDREKMRRKMRRKMGEEGVVSPTKMGIEEERDEWATYTPIYVAKDSRTERRNHVEAGGARQYYTCVAVQCAQGR